MNEGYKAKVYEQRTMIALYSFAYMDEDEQARVQQSLRLPEDLLDDIIGDEEPDDINKLREALEGEDDGN